MSTATRGRFTAGSAWFRGPENPWLVVWNGIGVSASPVTGSRVEYLSLKTIFSNVRPAVGPAPATMYATSLAMSR